MPMLRRGYGAVRNLRCKSCEKNPPPTVFYLVPSEIRARAPEPNELVDPGLEL